MKCAVREGNCSLLELYSQDFIPSTFTDSLCLKMILSFLLAYNNPNNLNIFFHCSLKWVWHEDLYNIVRDQRPKCIKISRFKRMVYLKEMLRYKKALLRERCTKLLVYFKEMSFSSLSTSTEVPCIKMTSVVQYLCNLTIDAISINRKSLFHP